MIHFVGAGPGDPELISGKGIRLLQEAEVVIYDRLVNPLLLYHCSQACRFVYVGKIPDELSIKQSEINQILAEYGTKFQHVVRLKGGDPAIFGRLVEELETCQNAEIPYTIVPGITAASGTAAYQGIPLTARKEAQSVLFTTGRLAENVINDFKNFGGSQTLCLYMGMEALPKFLETMQANQVADETPILVVQWGTYGRQKSVEGTFKTILPKLKAAALKNPAMIIIGEVVKYREKFHWFDTLSQAGETILFLSDQPPILADLYKYTATGADVWWYQVGPQRDQRFDEVHQIYLAERTFEKVRVLDNAEKYLGGS